MKFRFFFGVFPLNLHGFWFVVVKISAFVHFSQWVYLCVPLAFVTFDFRLSLFDLCFNHCVVDVCVRLVLNC